MDADATAVVIHFKKESSLRTAQYWKDLDERREIWGYYEAKAEQFIKDTILLTAISEAPSDNIRTYKNFKQDVHKHVPGAEFVEIAYLNWAAPSCIKASAQRCQPQLMGYMAADDVQKMLGIILEPVYYHQRGQLFNVQHQALKALTEAGLNLDQQFYLQFEAKSDCRDSRPTSYPGRIGVPIACKESEHLLKNCALIKVGRTAVVPMLPGRNMIAEIPESTPLPSQSSMDHSNSHAGPRAGKRFEQIGTDAVLALLDASLDNCDGVDAWLLSSLNVGVGHEVEAFIHKRATFAKPAFFWGLCESESQADWVKEETKVWLASQLQNHTISLPGVKVLDQKAKSEDDGSSDLTPPVLEVFKLFPDGVVRLPQALYNQWMLHPRFKAEFEHALDGVRQALGYEEGVEVISPEEVSESQAPNNKRQAGKTPPSPAKKPKVAIEDSPSLVAMDQVPAAEEARILWSNSKTEKQYYAVTKVGAKMQVWLVNSGDSVILHKANTPAIGHGHVKWRFADDADDIKPEELTYRITPDTLIYHDSKQLNTVMDVVEDMKKTKPNCKIAYHKMVEVHDKAAVFNLAPEAEVRCIQATIEAGSEEAKQMAISNAGPFIPRASWDGSPFVVASWATRWSAQGLMPVRPIEVFLQDLELQPKKALLLNP